MKLQQRITHDKTPSKTAYAGTQRSDYMTSVGMKPDGSPF